MTRNREIKNSGLTVQLHSALPIDIPTKTTFKKRCSRNFIAPPKTALPLRRDFDQIIKETSPRTSTHAAAKISRLQQSKLSAFASVHSPNTRSFLLVMMAAKTESDYESDEEFQERVSDELQTFYFSKVYDFASELEHELSKKRFDRAEKIIEILQEKYFLGDVSGFLRGLTTMVFRLMPAAEPGCSETLQFMSNHFGLGGYASDCAQIRMVVRQASLGGGNDSVDSQRVLAGNSFFGCHRSGLCCCTLIRASARGDLETVKSCLAVKEFQSFPESTFCHHVREFAVRVAAQYGHTHIVEAFFVEWERRAVRSDHQRRMIIIDYLRRDVLNIACRSSKFEMVVSILRARNEAWHQELYSFSSMVRPEVYCTTEVLRKVSLVMSEILDSCGDKLAPFWLEQVLKNAIKFRSLPHAETVLDEMNPNRSGTIFIAMAHERSFSIEVRFDSSLCPCPVPGGVNQR